jgi:hypothetical protein
MAAARDEQRIVVEREVLQLQGPGVGLVDLIADRLQDRSASW